MRAIATLMLILIAQAAGAAQSSSKAKYPNGIQAEFGVAKGQVGIDNPDQTKAYYSVLALQGIVHLPLLGDGDSPLAFDLVGSFRYLDLQNTAEVSGEKEVANLIGPGAGVHLRLFKLIGGYQIDYMIARHYSFGPVSRELNYSMTLSRAYAGLQMTFGQLSVSATYNTATGTVPQKDSGLSMSSAFTEQTYWLNLNYSTGTSFFTFLEKLFF